MGWIDAHCHLDLPPLSNALPQTLDWLKSHQIEGWILGGCHPALWHSHAQVAHAYEGGHWTIGHHPMYVVEQGWDSTQLEQIMHWVEAPLNQLPIAYRPCGFGELGLDLRKQYQPHLALQKKALRDQWALVRQYQLPVVLHVVRAHHLIFELFQKDGGPPHGGIVHAFNGSIEQAKRYLKWGIVPSIGAQILNPKARKLRQLVKALEPTQWVIETDAPDQAPLNISVDEYPPHIQEQIRRSDRKSDPIESPVSRLHTPLSIYRIAFEIGCLRERNSDSISTLTLPNLKKHPLTLKYLTYSTHRIKSIFNL